MIQGKIKCLKVKTIYLLLIKKIRRKINGGNCLKIKIRRRALAPQV